MLNADDLKITFITWLLNNEKNFIIGNEVLYSASLRRADLVMVKDNTMHAFEIKSDIDNTMRLNEQLEDYLQTFDRISVITTKKQEKDIKKKLNRKVGLIIINDDSVKFVRKPSTQKRLNKKHLSEFLDRKTLIAIIGEKGISKLSIFELRQMASDKFGIGELREQAINIIKTRYTKLFELFLLDIRDKKPSKDDLRSLTGNISANKLS